MALMDIAQDARLYFLNPGPMTDPGEYRPWLDELPGDVPALVAATQNLLVHIFWSARYGLTLTPEREAEVQIRPLVRKLARLQELKPGSLVQVRTPEERLVGNCRDFSVFLAGALKAKGIPARARCGFGTYFMPGHYEDHWMVEYWQAGQQRWVQVDAQLDALQQKVLDITFDPLDMPPGRFVLAGEAWQMCRRGEANPDDFGIFEWHGWDFIRGNVLRDLLSLNQIELLPWDFWGLMDTPVADAPAEETALVDRAAELTLAGDTVWLELWSFYRQNGRLQPPPDLLS